MALMNKRAIKGNTASPKRGPNNGLLVMQLYTILPAVGKRDRWKAVNGTNGEKSPLHSQPVLSVIAYSRQ
jgi:hypothetical protein